MNETQLFSVRAGRIRSSLFEITTNLITKGDPVVIPSSRELESMKRRNKKFDLSPSERKVALFNGLVAVLRHLSDGEEYYGNTTIILNTKTTAENFLCGLSDLYEKDGTIIHSNRVIPAKIEYNGELSKKFGIAATIPDHDIVQRIKPRADRPEIMWAYYVRPTPSGTKAA